MRIIQNISDLMHDLVYESDINSVSKSVTLKEDMCHTLQNTGC